MSTNKCDIDSFLLILNRVKSELNISKDKELLEIVESTQSKFSRKKSENEFPVEWAYKIACKYNLLTEWVLTGNGPKSLDKISSYNEPFLSIIDTWIRECNLNDPGFSFWFRKEVKDNIRGFDEWLKRREIEEGKDNSSPLSKIA